MLQSAYARCGEVTEDYGRTFYMGACRGPAARQPGGDSLSLYIARPASSRLPTPHAPARPPAATQLMTEQRRKAIWAIYGAARPPARPARSPLVLLPLPVWCRRTDELVDGPNSPYITPAALDRWKVRQPRGGGAQTPAGRPRPSPRFMLSAPFTPSAAGAAGVRVRGPAL